MSRDRFIEIVAELHKLEAQLRPLLDRKAALEAERDALWPAQLPAPAQLTREQQRERLREQHVDAPVSEAGEASDDSELFADAVQGLSNMEGVTQAVVLRRRRSDGPTAARRVLAFMQEHPGEWLRARQVCEGMKLDLSLIQAVRASLERLSPTVQKNEQGEFRLAPATKAGEKQPIP